MTRLKRIWHPISAWEEMASPMWEGPSCSLEDAIAFTGDHITYGKAMARVIEEWPISCENALTNYNINRQAWIGHAAAALEIGAAEKVTRKAWGMLNERQRTLANREAARHIGLWEERFIESRGLHEDMGRSLLFGGDTRLRAG